MGPDGEAESGPGLFFLSQSANLVKESNDVSRVEWMLDLGCQP